MPQTGKLLSYDWKVTLSLRKTQYFLDISLAQMIQTRPMVSLPLLSPTFKKRYCKTRGVWVLCKITCDRLCFSTFKSLKNIMMTFFKRNLFKHYSHRDLGPLYSSWWLSNYWSFESALKTKEIDKGGSLSRESCVGKTKAMEEKAEST